MTMDHHHLNATFGPSPTLSFAGHIAPGGLFVFWGFWWLIGTLGKYFEHLANKDIKQFKCSTTYHVILSVSLPTTFEPIVCLVIGSGLMSTEFITGFSNGRLINYDNVQHISMYTFFLLTFVIEILVLNGFPFPEGSDYLALAMAMFLEAIVFGFHVHSRTSLDIQVHKLLVVILLTMAVSVLVEWKHRNSVLAGLFRTICMLVQGTWLCQAAFTLYPPEGWTRVDQNSHFEVMMITAKFCWHVAAAVVFVGSVFCFYHRWYKHLLDADSLRSLQYSSVEDDEEKLLFEKKRSVDLRKSSEQRREDKN